MAEKALRDKIKLAVHEAYGSRCCWCKESDPMVLVIDHVYNDGAFERKTIGQQIYPYIVKQGFPDKYQLLCANCNMAKHINKGILPEHRKK